MAAPVRDSTVLDPILQRIPAPIAGLYGSERNVWSETQM